MVKFEEERPNPLQSVGSFHPSQVVCSSRWDWELSVGEAFSSSSFLSGYINRKELLVRETMPSPLRSHLATGHLFHKNILIPSGSTNYVSFIRKLLVTSASLLVTSALLLVTRSY